MGTHATRDRITETATVLFRRQGLAGTGLAQIAAESGARVGSIYHFFDGKDAIAEEVVRTSGGAYGAMVMALLESGPDDPVEALAASFDVAAVNLQETGWADACPIATIALEVASTHERLRMATADVFQGWTESLTSWCRRIVDDEDRARDLALAVITTLEGAFVLARARRDPEPLHAAGRTIRLLAATLRAAGSSGSGVSAH